MRQPRDPLVDELYDLIYSKFLTEKVERRRLVVAGEYPAYLFGCLRGYEKVTFHASHRKMPPSAVWRELENATGLPWTADRKTPNDQEARDLRYFREYCFGTIYKGLPIEFVFHYTHEVSLNYVLDYYELLVEKCAYTIESNRFHLSSSMDQVSILPTSAQFWRHPVRWPYIPGRRRQRPMPPPDNPFLRKFQTLYQIPTLKQMCYQMPLLRRNYPFQTFQ